MQRQGKYPCRATRLSGHHREARGNPGIQMHLSARTYYIASVVCAALAVFAFFGFGTGPADQGPQMSPTTMPRSVTVSAETKLKRFEEERTLASNELRDAQDAERKRLLERVEALDAEVKKMRTLVQNSKQDAGALRTMSKDIAQIAGSVASVVSVMLAILGRRRQSSA